MHMRARRVIEEFSIVLRVVTFNAKGIRSATNKGFWEWFEQQNADML